MTGWVPFASRRALLTETNGERGTSQSKSGTSDEVPRGEKMLYSGTDPESYITEYTLIYEDKKEWSTAANPRSQNPRSDAAETYSRVLALEFRVSGYESGYGYSLRPYGPAYRTALRTTAPGFVPGFRHRSQHPRSDLLRSGFYG